MKILPELRTEMSIAQSRRDGIALRYQGREDKHMPSSAERPFVQREAEWYRVSLALVSDWRRELFFKRRKAESRPADWRNMPGRQICMTRVIRQKMMVWRLNV
jgi:hypothetical protein